MRLLLINDRDAAFLEQAIETWMAVYESDREGYAQFQFERVDVLRKLAGKYTAHEVEQIAQTALELMD